MSFLNLSNAALIPTSSNTFVKYSALAFSGSSSLDLQLLISPKFPSNSSYTAVLFSRYSGVVEKSVVIFPLWLYAVQSFILSSFPIVST